MTSQPDPKDGPPEPEMPPDYDLGAVIDEWTDPTAPRVVPPEADEQPSDEVLRRAAAVLAGGLESWWTMAQDERGYEWTETKDSVKATEVFIALKTVWREFAAALRASGAGTRQEEEK